MTLGVLVQAAPPRSARAAEPVGVLLFAGQSNMAGSGVVDELDAETRARIAAVADRVTVIRGAPDDARPLGAAGKRFGPELFVGLTRAEAQPGRSFVLIKTALGGTSLYGAWNPQWTAERAQEVERGEERQTRPLYAEHRDQTAATLQGLARDGRPYTVEGVFWMQGEMDTRREATAAAYGANLRRLIAAYRADLELPDLPFVFGQVNNPVRGKQGYGAGPGVVRAAMAEVAQEVPDTAMVPTRAQAPWSDFPKRDYDVHYDTQGQRRLGEAMAAAWLTLRPTD